MQFVLENIVQLKPIFKWNGNFKNKSRILVKGRDINCVIDGIFLDCCIEVFLYYLLIVSYHGRHDEKDCLFVYLLSKDGVLLDEVIIRVRFFEPIILPVGTDEYEADLNSYWGNLSNISLLPPNKIGFKFANHFWEIEVFEKPLYSWSFFVFNKVDVSEDNILLMRNNWQYKTYFKFTMI
ncbi:unnamed protein product [Commensalibacter communis]|uniref:hypothetical protein n=1 Tax=Commensalibacter communis TaxID=2972786 RepID=UPI0022FF67CE|nr:hypothetical protein [Commensalibacter communis]CAI3924965.1 unnamed protein product [Commensalibacter communis]CAI3934179.1 unnamed protein product [Commensalibacter communis]